MSRMRTPLSASMAGLFLLGAGVETGDAAALGAGGLVDHRVDERRLARAQRFFHRASQLRRRRGVHADAAERLDDPVVARALDEYRRCRIAAIRIDVGAAV